MKKALITLLCFAQLGCDQQKAQSYQGYIENKFSYISSSAAGKLTTLSVDRWQTVRQGDLLFKLEAAPESDELAKAEALMQQSLFQLKDLEKGARDTKLDEIRAQIDQAKAEISYNQKLWDRREALVGANQLEEDLLDQATRDLKKSNSLLAQYQANLADAMLPARINQIRAAAAGLNAAAAKVARAKWALGKKTVTAPEAGIIFDTFYNIGEKIPAYSPVLALIVPHNTHAITFIPEASLSTIQLNDKADISCDSCPNNISGYVSYISNVAEYTPPVIYSRESRSKLLYQVEISFTDEIAKQLHPGQPVDVTF